jgi:hypothetical protein
VLLIDELLMLTVVYFSIDECKLYFPGDFRSDGKIRQVRYRFRIPLKVIYGNTVHYVVFRSYYTLVGTEIEGAEGWKQLAVKRNAALSKKGVVLSFRSCRAKTVIRGNVFFEHLIPYSEFADAPLIDGHNEL